MVPASAGVGLNGDGLFFTIAFEFVATDQQLFMYSMLL